MDAEPLLPRQLQLFAVVTLLAMLAWVLRLVRARRLNLRDSLLWVVLTGSALGLVLFPPGLKALASLVGAEVPSNALFALGFVYVLLNLLSSTIAISGNAERLRRLTQECALLRAEIEELKKGAAESGRGGARGPALPRDP